MSVREWQRQAAFSHFSLGRSNEKKRNTAARTSQRHREARPSMLHRGIREEGVRCWRAYPFVWVHQKENKDSVRYASAFATQHFGVCRRHRYFELLTSAELPVVEEDRAN